MRSHTTNRIIQDRFALYDLRLMFASFTSFRAKALAMNRREAVMSSLIFSQIVWRDKCVGLIVMNNNFNEWLSL